MKKTGRSKNQWLALVGLSIPLGSMVIYQVSIGKADLVTLGVVIFSVLFFGAVLSARLWWERKKEASYITTSEHLRASLSGAWIRLGEESKTKVRIPEQDLLGGMRASYQFTPHLFNPQERKEIGSFESSMLTGNGRVSRSGYYIFKEEDMAVPGKTFILSWNFISKTQQGFIFFVTLSLGFVPIFALVDSYTFMKNFNLVLIGSSIWTLIVVLYTRYGLSKRNSIEQGVRPPSPANIEVAPRKIRSQISEKEVGELWKLIQNRASSHQVSYAKTSSGKLYLLTATETSLVRKEELEEWVKALKNLAA